MVEELLTHHLEEVASVLGEGVRVIDGRVCKCLAADGTTD